MKKFICPFLLIFSIAACNNNENKDNKDSVEKADSTNEVKEEQKPAVIQTDEATTEFLVKAADGGLTEVEGANLASQKATNAGVKRFAEMMHHDHGNANGEVKSLAAARNVTIPTTPSEKNEESIAQLSKKSGKDFDKDYMDWMVDDHKNDIKLFEKAAGDTKDESVKTFINNTLPTLRAHLESAKAIRKTLKG